MSWAGRHDAAFLSADPVVFVLYIYALIQQTRSVSSVNSAAYGVSWVDKKSGYQEPSEHAVVKQVVDAARQILARPAEHDLHHLSVDSFHFADSHVAIFLEKRKNDQFHKGIMGFCSPLRYTPLRS